MPDHRLNGFMDMVAPSVSATAVSADAHFGQLCCSSGQTMDTEVLDFSATTRLTDTQPWRLLCRLCQTTHMGDSDCSATAMLAGDRL